MTTSKGGRPKAAPHLERVHVPVRLPRWLAEWLSQQGGSRAAVIERALCKTHRLKEPK